MQKSDRVLSKSRSPVKFISYQDSIMGYNYKYNLSAPATPSSFLPRTPEQKAEASKNAEAIRWIKTPVFDPVAFSPKQIAWATSIFGAEKYFWHGYGLKIADIELFLATPEARSAKWWIDTCKDSKNGMIATGRIAIDAILDRLKQPAPTRATLSLKLKVGYPDRKIA